MSYRRKRKDIKSEINIVPFLDVLLVLLLIFMATAPVISQSVEVNLPEDKHSQQVSGVGLYKLKVGGNFMTGANGEELAEQEVVAFAGQEFQKDPNTMFLVAGDATVPYEEVIKGIVLLKDAGIEKAGLMTQGK